LRGRASIVPKLARAKAIAQRTAGG
jgi:hypothetical protein